MSASGPIGGRGSKESRFAQAVLPGSAGRQTGATRRSFDCAYEEAVQRLQGSPPPAKEGQIFCANQHAQSVEFLQLALEYRTRNPLNSYTFRSHSAEARDPRLPHTARKRLAHCDFNTFLFNVLTLQEGSATPSEDLHDLFFGRGKPLKGLQAICAALAEKRSESVAERRRSYLITGPGRPARANKSDTSRTRFSRVIAPGAKS